MARRVVKIARSESLRSETDFSSFRIEYNKVLNPQQLEAVTTINGPLLIIAGAGSGKTRVITYRTAFLAEKGVPPERIVLPTFQIGRASCRERVASPV